MKEKLSTLTLFVTFLITVMYLSGCGTMIHDQNKNLLGAKKDFESTGWLGSGSLSIARPAPQINPQSNTSIFAFMPVASNKVPTNITPTNSSLLVDRATNTISFYKGGSQLFNFKGEVAMDLPPGQYGVLLKQEQPMWYAPDRYFTERNLPLPGHGSAERFRRGALGDMAIFVTPELSIHSGPIGDPSIGGIRVLPQEMANIYSNLDIGSLIIVR